MIANEIRMKRTQYKGSFLVVEGDSDSRFFKQLTNNMECKIISAQSRTNVTGAIEILDNSNFKGVLAIIDNDFDSLKDTYPNSKNIFLTDTHDTETLILKSPAFDKIINEYFDIDNVKDYERFISNIRILLLENGKLIGFLRWYSLKRKLYLNFKKLSIRKCMDRNLSLTLKKIIKEVIQNTPHKKFNSVIVEKEISLEMKNFKDDIWLVCNGHDLTKILLIWIKEKFGKKSKKQNVKNWSSERLEGVLRVSYEFKFFLNTILYNSIKKWEKNNAQFIILKNN